ncbi:velvet 2 [Ophiocordyceps camponoti-floridani]|uniref:Velvet 2 n=1 Tax=Ophiocordyceps camponoti-floridani TaxID=2030778 RepID=A0A8H4VFY0_9HYPO|nr:velvet 2 [Ophiocordyceps camponoti-floridani]
MQPTPEHIHSSYPSPTITHPKLPPRLPQLSPRDVHRQNAQASPQFLPHIHSHAVGQPATSLSSNQQQQHGNTLGQHLQHHNAMHPPSQMQPPPPLLGSSFREEESPSGPYLPMNHQSNAPMTLAPFSKVDETTGRKYQLDVVQQPKRARMCGFGDKDRRPITPPPCVRLIITDATTGREIDCNSIDHSMFVLNVDLWNQDGTREVNLVRSSTGSPSISSTTPYSYTTLNGGDASMAPTPQHVLPSNRDAAHNSSHVLGFVSDYQLQPGYGHVPAPSFPSNGNYIPAQQFFPQHQTYRQDGAVSPAPTQVNISQFTRNGVPVAPGFVQDHNSLTRMAMVGSQPQATQPTISASGLSCRILAFAQRDLSVLDFLL